jgi:Tfp pilus assembly protein PilN
MLSESTPKRTNTSYVICLIPQQEVFLISQELPQVDESEAQSVLENKIADLLPMSLNDIYWDWRIASAESNKLQIQVVAASKQLVDSYMKCIQEAGLVALSMEPAAEAAARVGSTVDQTEGMLMVELNEKSAIVSVTYRTHIIFSTDIPLEMSPSGEVNTSQLLSRITEITNFTRQQNKQHIEISTQARVYGHSNIVEKVLTALGNQPNQTLSLSRIKYQHSEDNRIGEFLGATIDEYVPLIGAAIKGLPNHVSHGQSLNILPIEAKKAFTAKQIVSIVTRYIFFMMAVSLLAVIALFAINVRTLQTVEAINKEFGEIRAQAQTPEVLKLKKDIETLNGKTELVGKIKAQIYEWDRIFVLLSQVTPQSMEISSIAVTPDTRNKLIYDVIITGTYEDRISLLAFADSMRKSPYFQNVALPVASLEDEEVGDFSLEADLTLAKILAVNEIDK